MSTVRLTPDHVMKLEEFLETIKSETYPEPPSEPHVSIVNEMVEHLTSTYRFLPGSRVLDIGCGQGQALQLFSAKGLAPIGINLNQVDIAACREKGFEVLEMDQSFLEFPNDYFDLVWCRHCLEHSIFPYFTLYGFHRVLNDGGYLYIEVPAPDTSCRHQSNKNHYSVMPKSMWSELMLRTGFSIIDQLDIQFTVPAGPDTYWAFILQKHQT